VWYTMSGRLTRQNAMKNMKIPDETPSQYEDRVRWTSLVSAVLNLCTVGLVLYIAWAKGSDLELGDVKNPFLQDDNKYTVLGATVVGVAGIKALGMFAQVFNVFKMQKGATKDKVTDILRTLFADIGLATSGWLVGQLEVDDKLNNSSVLTWATVILILNAVDRFLQLIIDLDFKSLCSHTNGECADEERKCYLYNKVAQGQQRLYIIIAVIIQLVVVLTLLIIDRAGRDHYGDYDFFPTLALILVSVHILVAFIALIARCLLFNAKSSCLVIAFSEYPFVRLIVVMTTLISVVLTLGHMMYRGYNVYNYVLILSLVLGVDLTGRNVI